MPPARKSATSKPAARASKPAARASKPAARASKATRAVRARAATTRQATRREVEQSIARFEKRLDDANAALKALGGHLGRSTQGSYKEMTSALIALRREAAKTNKQALKDFDKLRTAITHKAPAAAKSSSGAKRSTASKSSSGSSSRSSRSTASRKSSGRTTAARSTASRSTSSGSTGTRKKSTRAKKSTS